MFDKDEFRFTAYSAPKEAVELVMYETLIVAQEPDHQPAAGPVIPVEDEDGGLWICRETDNSCECIPWFPE